MASFCLSLADEETVEVAEGFLTVGFAVLSGTLLRRQRSI